MSREVTVYVDIGIAGHKEEKTFEVSDDASDELIEELAESTMWDMVNWYYEVDDNE